MMTDSWDIMLRLGAATISGMIIGANRDLRGRPAGMRTMGLVALGAAMISVIATHLPMIAHHPDALSRVIQGVIQGIMAGIGFIGAGVMVKGRGHTVHGLTTAAAVWVTAALGVTAGLGVWSVFVPGAAAALFLIAVVYPVESWLEGIAERKGRSKSLPPDQYGGDQ